MVELKKFSEILGQPQAINLLKRAIEKNRLSHAYLFYGMRGVGKKTTAYAFAGTLFCKASKEGKPCSTCPSCKKLTKAIHPDFMLIFPEKKEITISQIRKVREFIRYRPVEAEYQVVLIEEAEKMNPEAANALLKSLEEPPEYTIFILLTQNPSRMLPTILSRCQPVRFNPIPTAKLKEFLKKRGFEETVAETLAELSQGSMGIALEIAEKGLLEELSAFVKAFYSSGFEKKFRIAERLARLPQSELELFFYLLKLWVWRSYLERALGKPYPRALPEERFQGNVYQTLNTLNAVKENLRYYISPELSFIKLVVSLKHR